MFRRDFSQELLGLTHPIRIPSSYRQKVVGAGQRFFHLVTLFLRFSSRESLFLFCLTSFLRLGFGVSFRSIGVSFRSSGVFCFG